MNKNLILILIVLLICGCAEAVTIGFCGFLEGSIYYIKYKYPVPSASHSSIRPIPSF